MADSLTANPLVSVIIPCYNQAHFLQECVRSVLAQNYSPVEIVVVDDGSTDGTREVAESFESVHYVFQQNAGLSAARNTGIENSQGQLLVFLDSDDWLFPEAIKTNVEYLQQHTEAVFVSGSHLKVSPAGTIAEERSQITLLPYHQLLHQNYIGMIAAVMFRRQILQQYRYNTSLKSCEDYDLYLRITRDHPVVNHTREIAAYRIHGNSMSGNIPLMLEVVSKVLLAQQKDLRGLQEEKYLLAGLENWKKFYYKKYYLQLSQDIAENRVSGLKELHSLSDPSSLYLTRLKLTLMARYTYYKTKRILVGLFRL